MRRRLHVALRAPGKSALRSHVLVNLRDTLKDALARHQGALPLLEGAREAPLTSSQRPTALPEVSTAPVEPSQQHERAESLQDHGVGTAELRMLTAAQRRLQVSRKVIHRSVRAGTFPERAPTGRRETPTRSLLALPAQALGRGLSQRPPTRA